MPSWRAHAHAGALARELRQQPLREVVHAGRQAESQLALLAARMGERDILGGACRFHGGASGGEHRGARFGQLDAAARTGEQREADLGLEPLELLAEGRLGDVQLLCSATEVQLVGERDERAQQTRIERHARSL